MDPSGGECSNPFLIAFDRLLHNISLLSLLDVILFLLAMLMECEFHCSLVAETEVFHINLITQNAASVILY